MKVDITNISAVEDSNRSCTSRTSSVTSDVQQYNDGDTTASVIAEPCRARPYLHKTAAGWRRYDDEDDEQQYGTVRKYVRRLNKQLLDRFRSDGNKEDHQDEHTTSSKESVLSDTSSALHNRVAVPKLMNENGKRPVAHDQIPPKDEIFDQSRTTYQNALAMTIRDFLSILTVPWQGITFVVISTVFPLPALFSIVIAALTIQTAVYIVYYWSQTRNRHIEIPRGLGIVGVVFVLYKKVVSPLKHRKTRSR